MPGPERIHPKRADALLKSDSPPLLVCGYDDEKAFANAKLPGAISHPEFLERAPDLDRKRGLIFYCG